jgi:hypothetical protein
LDVGSPFFKAGQSAELSPSLSLLLIEMLAHLCHPDSNPPHLLTAAHVQCVVIYRSFIILLRIAAMFDLLLIAGRLFFCCKLHCYFHQNMSLTSFQFTVCRAKKMLLKHQNAHFIFDFLVSIFSIEVC